jgi:murein DD-endopeptidase MepM/ murein hydrolase activator NlpD
MGAARKLGLFLFLFLVVVVGGALLLVWPRLEGQPPSISLPQAPSHLGRANTLEITARDDDSGLSRLKATLTQNNKEVTLLDKPLGSGGLWAKGPAEVTEKLEIKALELGFAQGPATLAIEARDCSLQSWFHGNLTRQAYDVVIDTVPPRVTVLSRTIHLNRGGVGLAIYKVSEPTARDGVQVGGRFFRGYAPWPQDPLARMAFFAFAEDEDKGAPIKITVEDQAGNPATAGLMVRLKWKEFRDDNINLSNNFLEALAPRFMAEAPPDRQSPLQVFTWVNESLRQQNHARMAEAVRASQPQQLWQRQPFLRPMGKPMAGFAERRTYSHEGRPVSRSTHLGVDLADVAMSPIPATADGVVVFAGPLGIYGECVILDHGLGVHSLYGHLSALAVQVGQRVAANEVLGRSGATGLALGDHLHYSILVGGVFVTPTEWWDPHWFQDNVDLRYQEAGLPRPTAPRP